MTNIVIASAARTAVGSFGGSFANTPAHDLGGTVLEAVVARAGVEKAEVSETILGQVLTAAQGQNPARQAHTLTRVYHRRLQHGALTKSAVQAYVRLRWRHNTSNWATQIL